MIKFQNITKIYEPNIVALDSISFDIQPKEFVSLVGKSGAGKTTLLKMILAEESPTHGRVFLDDQDVHRTKKSKLPLLRRRIGSVFQDYKLLPSKTAYENVAYALEVIGASDEEISRDVPEVLGIVGLADRANNFPVELSGGEKQRVAIARALVNDPTIIFADEPTGNLDSKSGQQILEILEKLNNEGRTIILVTHEEDTAKHAKRIIKLRDGQIESDKLINGIDRRLAKDGLFK